MKPTRDQSLAGMQGITEPQECGEASPSALSALTRRQMLKLGGAILTPTAGIASNALPRAQSRRPKKVIVAGGGIAGLSCAYELAGRGHNVVLLEAAGRAGGHVRTTHDLLADGLYADVGAEHFYKPIYKVYWKKEGCQVPFSA